MGTATRDGHRDRSDVFLEVAEFNTTVIASHVPMTWRSPDRTIVLHLWGLPRYARNDVSFFVSEFKTHRHRESCTHDVAIA